MMKVPKKSFVGIALVFALVAISVYMPMPNFGTDALFAAPQGQHVIATKTFAPVTVSMAVPAVNVCAGGAPHCVSLSWVAPTANTDGSAIAGAVTYDVMRATVSGGPYTKVTTAPISTVTFEDDTVLGGATYFYIVVAYGNNSTSPSANSNQASVALPQSPINPPTGLVAVPKQ